MAQSVTRQWPALPESNPESLALWARQITRLLQDGAIANGGQIAEFSREVLGAARTYYVRTDGSDSNTGLADSAAGAFLTIQKGVDVVYGTLDLGGFDVTIQVRDGTFARAVVPFAQVGKGNIVLQGNAATPANVVLTATAIGVNTGVVDARNNAILFVRDFAANVATSGDCFLAANAAAIFFQNIRFGAAAGHHIHARTEGRIEATGNYAITAGAATHLRAAVAGLVSGTSFTVTLTGTPAFSTAFAVAIVDGGVSVNGNTYSGAATGKRFDASIGGVINSASLTDLPGDVAGTVATGGVHPSLVDYVTDVQVRAATAGRFVFTVDKLESAAAGVALTDAATVAVNWDNAINFTLTVTTNRIIGNPTNGQPGTWRTILVQGNDATDRTITFDTQYLGELPVVTDADSGRKYLLMIYCVSASHFVVSAKRAQG